MDVLSMVISLLSFIFSIVTFFKLHIIYVPLILCELAGEMVERLVRIRARRGGGL